MSYRGASWRKLIGAATVALFVLLLTACHISINSKYGAFAREEASAEKAGMDYGGGSGVAVGHFAGLTYSKSVTYIVGKGGALKGEPVRDATFAVSHQGLLDMAFFHYSKHCVPDAYIYSQLGRIAKSVFRSIDDGMPTGVVNVYLVPESVGIAKQRFAVRTGLGVDLAFYYPCESTNADRSAFAGFLDVMHEITHLIVGLRRLPVSGKAGEDLARGGPACVYEMLSKGDSANLADLIGPDTYFRSDPLFRETDGPPDIHLMCTIWKDTLEK